MAIPQASWLPLLVLGAAVVLHFSNESAISGPGDPNTPKLGEGGYDLRVLDAPVAGGRLLQVVSWVLSRSPLGPLILRALLNSNKIRMLRELGHQAEDLGHPLVFHPIRRLSASEHLRHAQHARERPLEDVLRKGLGPPFRGHGQPYWSVDDFAAAYRSGRLTPSGVVVERVLPGVARLEPLKIWAEVIAADVVAQARAADARFAAGRPLSVLDGVPIAVKDMVCVRGHTVRGGTRCPACPAVTEDDPIIARFRAAGAILVGTTAMTEFGVSPLGYNVHNGGPVNPYDPDRYPGGSSSGSAVAVAVGLVPIALGFDGGGSIRIPASVSGVVGLANTFARVPHDRYTTSTMLHAGALAATFRDAAYAYAVMAPENASSAHSRMYGPAGLPQPSLHALDQTGDLSDVVLGVFRDHFADATEEIVRACDAAVRFLVDRGARVVNITIPHMQWLSMAHGITISSEFSSGQVPRPARPVLYLHPEVLAGVRGTTL